MLAQGQALDPTMGQLSSNSDTPGMPLGSNLDSVHGGMVFPSALLEQYPALANMEWGSLPPDADELGDGGDASNRSSFDAASGGEWDDGSVSGGSALGSHRNSFDGSRGDWSGNEDWGSDTGGDYRSG